MARISEQSIEKVRQAADIVEVVGGYIELKNRGRNFLGLCPFHNDNKPSLSVSPDKQIFKCFSCNAGGGSINFVMDYEKLEFVDAVKKLAQNYNILLDIQGGDSKKFADTKSQLIAMHNYATKYYHNILLSDKGKEAFSYLKERGLSKDIIEQFQLGFSPDSGDDLLNLLRKEAFSSEAMKSSGLFIKSEKGYFNRFRSRIMFPIQNQQGDFIAFGGRIFNKDNPAKYLNSPDTPIYYKSNILYGLNHNIQDIRLKKEIILVEGYMDLLQLVQAGITNCLAISGTAFTDGHAKILKRFTNKIFITFDGDDPGITAAIKCGYMLIKNSLEPKIITPPDEMDPDDWVRKQGSDGFNDGIKNSEKVIKSHYNYFSSNQDTGSLGVTDFIEQCLQELISITNPIVQEIMINEISDLTSIDKTNIIHVLNEKINLKNKRQSNKIDNNKPESQLIKKDTSLKLYDDIIKLCFAKDKNIRTFIFENLNDNWLLSELHKDIYKDIYIHLKSADAPPVNIIAEQISNKESRQKLIDLTFNIEKFNHSRKLAIDTLIRIEQKALQSSVDNLREKLKTNNNLEILEQLKEIENNIENTRSKYDE
jgi:DNA primase